MSFFLKWKAAGFEQKKIYVRWFNVQCVWNVISSFSCRIKVFRSYGYPKLVLAIYGVLWRDVWNIVFFENFMRLYLEICVEIIFSMIQVSTEYYIMNNLLCWIATCHLSQTKLHILFYHEPLIAKLIQHLQWSVVSEFR